MNIVTGNGYIDLDLLFQDSIIDIIFPNVSQYTESKIDYLDTNIFTNFIDNMILLNKCTHVLPCNEDYFIKIDFTNLMYSYTGSFLTSIINCLNLPYNHVFIPVHLIFKEGGHSNLIIIDKKYQLIYFFEPHGEKNTSNITKYINIKDNVIKIIKSVFTSLKTYNNKNIFENCKLGVQSKQDNVNTSGGYCLSWSLLTIHLILLNPNIDIDIILSWLNMVSDLELDIYIKKYTGYVYTMSNISCSKSDFNNTLTNILPINLSSIENDNINNKIYEFLINKETDILQTDIRLFILFHDFNCRYFHQQNKITYEEKINKQKKLLLKQRKELQLLKKK